MVRWSNVDKLISFNSLAGVRRDGTKTENNYFTDGVWVRWQRKFPRKMGGYRAMSTLVNGPVRSVLIDSRNGVNSAHYFSQYGVQRQQFSQSGAGGSVDDRTPPGYYTGGGNPNLTWTQGIMTSSTGGKYSALLAASSPDINQIDSDVGGDLLTGDMLSTAPLSVVSDGAGPISVSGGVTVLQPFCFVYGSSGLIRNSDANNLTVAGWTAGTGYANAANVAGTKFIYGAPVRGGSGSPAGLFWALDALVRVTFVGGTAFWQYDTLSSPTSIMGKKAVVEHDGKFFWPGTDRFLFYNGVVQELPNQMNCNWFFDNLNYAARNKVWGTKIPRFGEIWWFYPRGNSTECDNAVIFNYVENTWYDAVKTRSAGGQVQIFPFPVWAGAEDVTATSALVVGSVLVTSASTAIGSAVLTFASTAGVVVGQTITNTGFTVSSLTSTTVTMSAVAVAVIPAGTAITSTFMSVSPFVAGDLVTGVTSGATGRVVRSSLTQINVASLAGTFLASESLTGPHAASAITTLAPFNQPLSSVYQHEFGYDKIIGQRVEAIRASFTSKQFGFAVGNPFEDQPQTDDVMTRMTRVEYDLAQVGDLTVTLLGQSFPNNDPRVLEVQIAGQDASFVEFREQERILQLTFESNTQGGFFEQGQINIKLEPGDERSSEQT